jgi:hypothetical protein
MDSYIVRIYRRGSGGSSEDVAGLIEEVGTSQRKPFQTVSGMITTIRQVIGRCDSEHAEVHELHSGKDAAVNE